MTETQAYTGYKHRRLSHRADMKKLLKLILQIILALIEIAMAALFIYVLLTYGLPLIQQIGELKK